MCLPDIIMDHKLCHKCQCSNLHQGINDGWQIGFGSEDNQGSRNDTMGGGQFIKTGR